MLQAEYTDEDSLAVASYFVRSKKSSVPQPRRLADPACKRHIRTTKDSSDEDDDEVSPARQPLAEGNGNMTAMPSAKFMSMDNFLPIVSPSAEE